MICEETSHCIGTHIQGFQVGAPQLNSASPIGGQYGNPYNALVGAIEKEPAVKPNGVWPVLLDPPENNPP